MTGNTYTIGLVGAGRMGARWAKIVSEHPGIRLSVVVDTNELSGKSIASAYGAQYCCALDEALKCEYADAYIVATPHNLLAKSAKKILSAHKHVLLEKPGARSSEELIDVITLAKKNKKICMVGFNYRFFDAIQKAHSYIKSGKMGELLLIRITHGHAGRPGYGNEWRMNKKISGGGVLIDQGIHIIDLALWIMKGTIRSVKAELSNKYLHTRVEDNAFVIVKNSTGIVASLSVGITEWKPIFLLEIIGTKGSCEVNGVGRKYGGREVFTTRKIAKDGSVTTNELECNSDPEYSLHSLLAEFVGAIAKKKNPSPQASDAYHALQVIDTIYEKK